MARLAYVETWHSIEYGTRCALEWQCRHAKDPCPRQCEHPADANFAHLSKPCLDMMLRDDVPVLWDVAMHIRFVQTPMDAINYVAKWNLVVPNRRHCYY